MSEATCSIEGCGRPAIVRGYCNKCYQRLRYQKALPPRSSFARDCAWCGNPFTGLNPKQRYCKQSCTNEAMKERRSVGIAPRERASSTVTAKSCARCGKQFVGRNNGARFCSRVCIDAKRVDGSRRMRQRKYGLSESQFRELLLSQNDRCAICGTSAWNGRYNAPHVDHDHTTGATRGILCASCNHGLGRFRDSLVFLRAAVAYLEKYQTL